MKTRKPRHPRGGRRPPALQTCNTTISCAAVAPNVETELVPAPTMMPALQAVDTVRRWSSDDADIMKLVVSFGLQDKALKHGDLANAERMLMAQASTLDVIFNELARLAAAHVGQSLTVCDAYLRLALKAQSQCRATLEALSVIKNPRPVSFVRQANIANGPQQVNNGVAPPASRAREADFRPIELLEQQHGERLDAGAAQAAVADDSAVAAMAEVHRSTDDRR